MLITCTKCKARKRSDQFYDDSRKSNGKRSDCKACVYERTNAARALRRKSDPAFRSTESLKALERAKHRPPKTDEQKARAKKYQRTYRLKKLYKMTTEEYEAMVRKQKNRCKICGRKPDPDGPPIRRVLHIDHNEETGLVRGLLCGPCNAAIGLLQHDPRRIRKAAAYLEPA